MEIEARPGPSELTLANNRAVVTIYGVRDRLRVLLISGQPHAGERVWRSLLKADPSVDLVHFTILRPPDKQDQTPIDQLSLIAFPTRELFVEKLNRFRYGDFRPVQRTRYPADGIFREYRALRRKWRRVAGVVRSRIRLDAEHFRTPLASVLPAQPTGEVVTQPFKPMLTPTGQAHPVTRPPGRESG